MWERDDGGVYEALSVASLYHVLRMGLSADTHIGGAMTVVTTEFAIKIANARKAKPSSTKMDLNKVSRMAIRAPNSRQATPVRIHSTT